MLNRPVLLYDGDCGFCLRWVDRLRRWDRRGAIDRVASRDRHLIAGLPPLDQEKLDGAMHLVAPDGSVTSGARTLPVMARYLPLGGIVRVIFAVPGVPALADRVYAWIARRRHRLGCSASCRV